MPKELCFPENSPRDLAFWRINSAQGWERHGAVILGLKKRRKGNGNFKG